MPGCRTSTARCSRSGRAPFGRYRALGCCCCCWRQARCCCGGRWLRRATPSHGLTACAPPSPHPLNADHIPSQGFRRACPVAPARSILSPHASLCGRSGPFVQRVLVRTRAPQKRSPCCARCGARAVTVTRQRTACRCSQHDAHASFHSGVLCADIGVAIRLCCQQRMHHKPVLPTGCIANNACITHRCCPPSVSASAHYLFTFNIDTDIDTLCMCAPHALLSRLVPA